MVKNGQGRVKEPKLFYIFVLILIISAAAFLRVGNLGKTSFWVDELNTFYTAQSYADNGQFNLPSGLEYVRGSVQLFLTSVVFKFTDANEFSTRLIPAIFGILNVLMIFLLGRKFFNWKVGIFAAFLVGFSHFEIGWSRTARVYTVLQFLTLIFTYWMLLAFEFRKQEGLNSVLKLAEDSFFSRLKSFFASWGFSPVWLIPGFLLLGASYLYAHKLSVFWLASLFTYLAFMSLIMAVIKTRKDRFFNIYTLLSVLMLLAGVTILLVFKQAKTEFLYFITYHPPWATGASSAANRMKIFNFLMSEYRLPLFTLFIIGSVQAFFRYNRRAIFIFFMFATQVFLLSFVFSHRTETYIFNVFPFFLLLAAYGGVNLVNIETRISQGLFEKQIPAARGLLKKFQKQIPFLVMAAFLCIFLITPWLRVSVHIPFNHDGLTNGAETSSEWRAGCDFVKEWAKPDDIIISSLSATSLYYGLKSDYSLNEALLALAKTKKLKNSDGKWMDVYAGTEVIADKAVLQNIIDNNPSGWIIMPVFHWENIMYMPEEITALISERMGQPFRMKYNSLLVFHWPQEKDLD